MVMSGIALILLIIVHLDADCKEYIKMCNKYFKITIPTFIISLSMFLFVPTTKEALVIYGVGGTIDYLKENPTAKQIPDKCIKALDKWVDSLAEEKKNKEEE
jgi:hypothetical protein